VFDLVEIKATLYGDKAKEVAVALGLKTGWTNGDTTDVNTKVFFTLRTVEGHTLVDVTLEV
jgi:hypothetical protein